MPRAPSNFSSCHQVRIITCSINWIAWNHHWVWVGEMLEKRSQLLPWQQSADEEGTRLQVQSSQLLPNRWKMVTQSPSWGCQSEEMASQVRTCAVAITWLPPKAGSNAQYLSPWRPANFKHVCKQWNIFRGAHRDPPSLFFMTTVSINRWAFQTWWEGFGMFAARLTWWG